MRSDRSLRPSGFLRIVFVVLTTVAVGTALLPRSSPPRNGNRSSPSSVDRAPLDVASVAERTKETSGVIVASTTATLSSGDGIRRARAYRLLLDGDHVSLEAVENIRGRFRKRRALRARPGMLRCRLLGDDDTVLAEELVPAPDLACEVLDPMVPDADGAPRAAALTRPGPVVFQARLPEVDGATVLEILRIESVPGDATESAAGRLLAQIPLPSP